MTMLNRNAHLIAALLAAAAFAICAALAIGVVLSHSYDQLQQIAPSVQPAPGPGPYGGCDEAHRYPGTPGHEWCLANGYLE